MLFEIFTQALQAVTASNTTSSATSALMFSTSTFRMSEKESANYFQSIAEATFGKNTAQARMFKNLVWRPARTKRHATSYRVADIKGRPYAVAPTVGGL